MHLGHYGDSALNRKQRDAVRALRLLKEGQVQAVNGPPGTGKTSLLKNVGCRRGSERCGLRQVPLDRRSLCRNGNPHFSLFLLCERL
jgi:ABC-type hemin transport system ATPase subunit